MTTALIFDCSTGSVSQVDASSVEISRSIEEKRQRALTELANYRWLKTQYFVYDGVLTQADAAIGAVLGKLEFRKRLNVPSDLQENFKLSDSEFRKWDEGDLEAFGIAVGFHIQRCFDREAELTELIVNSDSPDTIDITVGWEE